jgi:hypothetical protein
LCRWRASSGFRGHNYLRGSGAYTPWKSRSDREDAHPARTVAKGMSEDDRQRLLAHRGLQLVEETGQPSGGYLLLADSQRRSPMTQGGRG